jgi:hypothetical protein
MTGFLTLNADPTASLHAASKSYVDGLVSGLIWLDPIAAINLISDALNDPPLTPESGDVYILSAAGINGWAAFGVGEVVCWDGAAWVSGGVINPTNFPTLRFMVQGTSPTTAAGSFAGQATNIAEFNASGVLTGFEVPVNNNAVFVSSAFAFEAFNQYAYNGNTSTWVLFGGGSSLTADGTTTVQVGNTLSVKQFSAGGIVDSTFWQGLIPTDLNLIYAPISHTHPTSSIVVTPYTTSPDWGSPTDVTTTQLNSVQAQAAFEEVIDEKATKSPLYTDLVDLPTAANVHGMLATVDNTDHAYYSLNGVWNELATNDGTVQNHDHLIPYDISFFVAGPAFGTADTIVGSFLSPRTLELIENGGSPSNVVFAYAETAPATATSFDVHVNGVSIGTIAWGSGSNTATASFPTPAVTINQGDRVQILSPSTPEAVISDVSITIIACGNMGDCPVTVI